MGWSAQSACSQPRWSSRECRTRPAPYFWIRQFGRMVQVLGDVLEGSNLEVVAEIP